MIINTFKIIFYHNFIIKFIYIIFIIFIYLNNIFSDNIPKKTIINFFYFSNKWNLLILNYIKMEKYIQN